jgi:hypothetical protein
VSLGEGADKDTGQSRPESGVGVRTTSLIQQVPGAFEVQVALEQQRLASSAGR